MAQPSNIPRRWRPAPLTGMKPSPVEQNVAPRALFDNIYGLEQTSLQSVTQGQTHAEAVLQVTGRLLQVKTGLDTISTVTVSIESDGTPISDVAYARASPQLPGAVDVFVYAPGPVLSGVKRNVHYHAVGTKANVAK